MISKQRTTFIIRITSTYRILKTGSITMTVCSTLQSAAVVSLHVPKPTDNSKLQGFIFSQAFRNSLVILMSIAAQHCIPVQYSVASQVKVSAGAGRAIDGHAFRKKG